MEVSPWTLFAVCVLAILGLSLLTVPPLLDDGGADAPVETSSEPATDSVVAQSDRHTAAEAGAQNATAALDAAESIVASLRPETVAAVDHADDATTALADARAAYRSPHRGESAEAFDRLVDALRALERLAATTDGDDQAIALASHLAVEASAASAKVTVVDAEQAVDAHEGALAEAGRANATQQHLDDATEALQRAATETPTDGAWRDDTTDASGDTQNVTALVAARANATAAYGDAWRAGDAAIGDVAAVTEPTLALERETAYASGDVARTGETDHANGADQRSERVVRIRATLSAARPYAYDDVVLESDDGERVDEIPLATTGPGATVATGIATVTVDAHDERSIHATARVAGNGAVELAGDNDVAELATENGSAEPTASPSDQLTVDPNSGALVVERLTHGEPDQRTSDRTNDSTVALHDPRSGVTVTASGDGLGATDLVVRDATPSDRAAYRYGPVVRVSNHSSVDAIEVDLPIEPTPPSEASTESLAIYAWSPEDVRGWQEIETDVDAENGTASATLDASGFVTVLDADAWRDYRVETIPLEDWHVEARPSTGEDEADDESATSGGESAPALVGHWPLETSTTIAPDRSPLDHHGRIVGVDDVEATDGPFGEPAYDLSNASASVSISSTDELRGGSDAVFSGSVWFRPTGTHDVENVGLLGKQANGSHGDWGLIVQEECPDHWRGGAVCEGAPPYVGYYSEVDGDDYGLFYGPIDRDQWQHAAFVLDQPDDTVRLYYDGRLVVEDRDAPLVSASTDAAVEIGATSYNGAFFEGAIDEARVYDRTLSAREVRSLYASNDLGGHRLADTSGDGIPDAVADANPPLPVPTQRPGDGDVLRAATEPSALDPVATDANRDGIADADQLDVRYRILERDGEPHLRTSVRAAWAHPARADTTGDGLSDSDQLDAGTCDDSDWFDGVAQPTTSPLVNDTSGDGRSDVVEHATGLDGWPAILPPDSAGNES